MREIKFRAWDLLNKQMIGNLDLWEIPYNELFIHTPDSRPFQMMQYTGLKDRNGKEIYEGDILRDKESFDEIYHYKVIWSDSNCCFYFKDISSSFDCFDCFCGEDLYLNQIEVIGNIYENPELIQG